MHRHHHIEQKDLNPDGAKQRIGVAFFINLGFSLLELFGGLLTNSVAILSDAIHDFGDSLSLGFSWYVEHIAQKGKSNNYQYGYRRFSLLGALINGFILLIGSVYILIQTVARLRQPEEADAQGMFLFALIGIAANSWAAFKLSQGESLNEKVVTWHLLEDVLGWVAILIGSVLLYFTQWPYIDPLLSIAINSYILFNVLKNLRKTLEALLLKNPAPMIEDQLAIRFDNIEILKIKTMTLDGAQHYILLEIKSSKDDSSLKKQIKDFLVEHNFQEIDLLIRKV